MKYLTNLTNSERILKWFNHDQVEIRSFLKRNGLDGIELMMEGPNLENIPKDCVLGMHLKYWPLWLDFWRGEKQSLLEQFGDIKNVEHFYGGLNQQALVDYYQREWKIAQELGIEYVVFHVAHVNLLDTYTWEFNYKDQDVLDAAVELVNKSFGNKDQGIKLLFENLWWPGLKLTDYSLAKKFLEEVDYPNKGFMLDIGHLMITNPQIKDEEEACDYISSTIARLQELKKYIRGIHLNKSLSGNYLRENRQEDIIEFKKITNFWDRIEYVKGHINKIDCHVPFDHPSINNIIDDLKPDYLVLELLASDLDKLEEMLRLQKSILR